MSVRKRKYNLVYCFRVGSCVDEVNIYTRKRCVFLAEFLR